MAHQDAHGAIVDTAAKQVGKDHHFITIRLDDEMLQGLLQLFGGHDIFVIGADRDNAVFVANQQRQTVHQSASKMAVAGHIDMFHPVSPSSR